MSKRFVALLAGVAALVMLMGGCGGSDEEPLTKAEYLKKADAICAKASSEMAADYQAFAKENEIKKGELPSSAQGREVAKALYLPNLQRRVESLATLSSPSGDEEKVEAFLSAAERGIAEAEKNINGLLGQGKYPFEEAKKIGATYGYKVCTF
jgi:hypothetical protein